MYDRDRTNSLTRIALALALAAGVTFVLLAAREGARERVAGRAAAEEPPAVADVLQSFLSKTSEVRVDLDNDGAYDSYWVVSREGGRCGLALHSLASQRKLWSIPELASCVATTPPVFHPRSFMGDGKRDFTFVYKGPGGAYDYYLLAGDGATGATRNFSLPLGEGPNQAMLRYKGTVTVDFKLERYPGPSLFVRSGGAGGQQRGRLFYFPSGSNDVIDLTEDPAVVNKALLQDEPFPGVDLANDKYTRIYNSFNAAACQKIVEVAWFNCGVPNDSAEIFLDKVAVGDIDADGFEDVLIPYWWRSAVYPGRPKGAAANLGAPQYDAYYNPQNGGSCHGGRHKGLSVLAQADDDEYLEMVDIAGVEVDYFWDLYQGVSRNVALVDTYYDPSSRSVQRRAAWNIPMNTSKWNCNEKMMFENALHVPDRGLLKSGARTRYLHFNRWTQTGPQKACTEAEGNACYTKLLDTQTGFWSWEVLNTDGTPAAQFRDMYVWDVLPDGNDYWLVYSATANIWNLGYSDHTRAAEVYRDDLRIGLFEMATGKLVNVTAVDTPAKPNLKASPWAQLEGGSSIGDDATKIMTVSVEGASLPGLVFKTASGPLLYARMAGAWKDVTALLTASLKARSAAAPAPGRD
jgi:hypothetical protein